MAQNTRNDRKASRKQTAEMETRLKALRRQEQTVQKKLSVLECSIVALPAAYQATRLRNWNTLPPPEEYRHRAVTHTLPRIHQERIRQARGQQALLALLLVTLLVGFAFWFMGKLQEQNLL